jgi:hypothetical protein
MHIRLHCKVQIPIPGIFTHDLGTTDSKNVFDLLMTDVSKPVCTAHRVWAFEFVLALREADLKAFHEIIRLSSSDFRLRPPAHPKGDLRNLNDENIRSWIPIVGFCFAFFYGANKRQKTPASENDAREQFMRDYITPRVMFHGDLTEFEDEEQSIKRSRREDTDPLGSVCEDIAFSTVATAAHAADPHRARFTIGRSASGSASQKRKPFATSKTMSGARTGARTGAGAGAGAGAGGGSGSAADTML